MDSIYMASLTDITNSIELFVRVVEDIAIDVEGPDNWV
jgi:hypothetical protein